jgi:hypothetical protein
MRAVTTIIAAEAFRGKQAPKPGPRAIHLRRRPPAERLLRCVRAVAPSIENPSPVLARWDNLSRRALLVLAHLGSETHPEVADYLHLI